MEILTGTQIEVVVSEVFTPTMFYIQQVDDLDKLDSLMEEMNLFYSSYPHLEQLVISPKKLRVEQKVAVVWEDGCWYRGLVKRVISVKLVEVDFMDYGSRTVTEKTALYNLEPQFCGLPRMSRIARLHGIAPLEKKWNRIVSTRFSDLVVAKGERKWVFKGNVIGMREGRVELQLVHTESVVTEGVNVCDVLVHEGHAKYVGQEGVQAISQETSSNGVNPLLPVLSILGDCLIEVERPLPSHFEEEMKFLKIEAIDLGQQIFERKTGEDLAKDQKKLVNKAVGLTLRILMESGRHAVDADEGDGDDTDDDSGVESTSVHSLYHSSQGRSVDTLSQEEDDTCLTGSLGVNLLSNTQHLPSVGETERSTTWQESLNLNAMVWSRGMIDRNFPTNQEVDKSF